MKRRYFDIKWLVIFIIIGLLLIFQVLPLVYLLYKSVFPNGSFSLEGFRRIYSYTLNWSALRDTIISSTFAMIFGTLIAFPLAWLVGRTNLIGKKVFRTLFVMTYMVPPYVGAMAWLRLLNPNAGILNNIFKSVFGLSQAPFNIYSMGGLIWVLTTFYYPFAFITISRAMEKMDPTLEEASRISGASPIKTLFTVTLPTMLPSIVAAALLVFVSAASCYGIPSIIGAPGKIYTVTTRIFEYVQIGDQQGLSDATVLAVLLMAMALLVMYISTIPVNKKQFITVSGKSMRPNIVDLGKWRWPISILVSLFSFAIVILPFLTVILTSFTMNMGKTISLDNMTLKFWKTVFSRSSILDSLKNSLISAAIAATLGLIIVCVMAYLLKRTKVKGRSIPDFLITVGSGTPSIVIALALIMTMTGKFKINIYNTLWIMVVAYMIKYMLMGMRTVVSAFSQISMDLEEVAQISGSGWLRRFKDIIAPLILPSIVAGWFLIFMPAFYELTMSNLLFSNSTRTLGVELYNYQAYHSQQTASAIATAILLFVIISNWLLNKLTKGKFSI